MLRENLKKVLSEYRLAKKEEFKKHPLASFLRRDFPQDLMKLVENPSTYYRFRSIRVLSCLSFQGGYEGRIPFIESRCYGYKEKVYG